MPVPVTVSKVRADAPPESSAGVRLGCSQLRPALLPTWQVRFRIRTLGVSITKVGVDGHKKIARAPALHRLFVPVSQRWQLRRNSKDYMSVKRSAGRM
jgi:hypothetical protein